MNSRKKKRPKLLPDPRVLVQLGTEPLEARDANKQGVIPVQTAKPELHVQVQDFPADKIASVEWEIDGQGLRKFEPPLGGDWTAKLTALQPGEHKVRIVVRTPGGRTPDTTVGPLTMLYQLPPPRIESTMRPNQTAKDAEFDIVGTVEQEVPDQPVDITVLFNGDPVAKPAGQDIRKRVTLKKGRNTVAIVAVNRKALADHEKRETERLDRVVWYDPTKPQIALADVVPLVGGKNPGQPVLVNPDQTVVLTVPKFRIRGTITAQEPLEKATLAGKALAGFQPGKKELKFDQEVIVTKAGLQTLTVAVATANTKEAQDLTIDYQPQLPSLVYVPSPEGRVFYDEGKGAPEVTLRYQLSPPEDPPPFDPALEVTVLIDGKKPAPVPVVERKGKDLTVKFTPQARDSQVQVRLTAPGARSEKSDDIHVQYLQPPYRLQFVKPIAESRAPVVDLTARVQSPLELTPDNVIATVSDKTIPDVVVEKQAGRSWLIRLKNVSLDGLKASKKRGSSPGGQRRRPEPCTAGVERDLPRSGAEKTAGRHSHERGRSDRKRCGFDRAVPCVLGKQVDVPGAGKRRCAPRARIGCVQTARWPRRAENRFAPGSQRALQKAGPGDPEAQRRRFPGGRCRHPRWSPRQIPFT